MYQPASLSPEDAGQCTRGAASCRTVILRAIPRTQPSLIYLPKYQVQYTIGALRFAVTYASKDEQATLSRILISGPFQLGMIGPWARHPWDITLCPVIILSFLAGARQSVLAELPDPHSPGPVSPKTYKTSRSRAFLCGCVNILLGPAIATYRSH